MQVFQLVSADLELAWTSRDGQPVARGTRFGTVRGPAGPLLTAERVALNFLQRMSGIATATARMQAEVQVSPAPEHPACCWLVPSSHSWLMRRHAQQRESRGGVVRPAVQGTGARVIETRKTVPGLRVLDKWGVLAGGGANHRIGLFDMVMIKDNHVTAAGGITAALKRTQARHALQRKHSA